MARRGDRVLIAGGGIGGLAAAIALARRGIDTEILERSDFTEQSGAGIQLGPNATRALQRAWRARGHRAAQLQARGDFHL